MVTKRSGVLRLVGCALLWGGCASSTGLVTPPPDVSAAVDASDTGPADSEVCNGGERQGPGGACRCTGDCEPGAECATEAESGFPGGMCLRPCDPADPPRAGFVCRMLKGGNAYIPTCGARGGTCRDAWFCRVYTGATRPADRYQCEPMCSDDAQCPARGHCDRYTGFCQATKEGRANNDPCTADTQCRGGLCFRSGMGACTSICDARTGFCPDDGYCLPPVQADAGAHNGSCLARCARLADCRAGFTCMRAMGQGVCVPNTL